MKDAMAILVGVVLGLMLFALVGRAQAQLAPVPLPPMGRATAAATNVSLSWDAPTLNNDLSPITNGAAFRIFVAYKLTPATTTWGAFTLTNTYPWTTRTSAVMRLPQGCYTFYVTALNSEGNESDPSAMYYWQLYKTWPQAVAATIQGR